MKVKYCKDNYMATKYGWTEQDFEEIQAMLYGMKSSNGIVTTPSEIKAYMFLQYNKED